MEKISYLLIAGFVVALLLSSAFAATTTTKPKAEQVKDSWNNVLCTILKVLEYTAVGLAALIIIVAGLRFMAADDPQARQGSKQMIVQVFAGLIIIFSSVQIVNYLTTGTRIDQFDMNACNVSFGTAPATSTTSTTNAGGTTSSTVSTSLHTTTSTTSPIGTTSCLSPNSATALRQIRACEMAQEFRHLDPGEDLCDVISIVSSDCCCQSLKCKCCPEPTPGCS